MQTDPEIETRIQHELARQRLAAGRCSSGRAAPPAGAGARNASCRSAARSALQAHPDPGHAHRAVPDHLDLRDLIDPRGLSRPDGLNLIPPGATLDAYARVLAQPTSNPISFLELAFNSLKIAVVTSAIAVGLGITAAYAFSRLKFRGRETLMIVILGVLMLPGVATLIPLYVVPQPDP